MRHPEISARISEVSEGTYDIPKGYHEISEGAHEISEGAYESSECASELSEHACEVSEGAFEISNVINYTFISVFSMLLHYSPSMLLYLQVAFHHKFPSSPSGMKFHNAS